MMVCQVVWLWVSSHDHQYSRIPFVHQDAVFFFWVFAYTLVYDQVLGGVRRTPSPIPGFSQGVFFFFCFFFVACCWGVVCLTPSLILVEGAASGMGGV